MLARSLAHWLSLALLVSFLPSLLACWLAGLPGFLLACLLARLPACFHCFSFCLPDRLIFLSACSIAPPAAKNRRRAGRGETVASGVSCSSWRRGDAPRSCHLRSSIGKLIAAYLLAAPRQQRVLEGFLHNVEFTAHGLGIWHFFCQLRLFRVFEINSQVFSATVKKHVSCERDRT